MPRNITNPPVARNLMSSLRSMGYSFESAVSDIIDNSISAKASRIDMLLSPDPDRIFFAILDNGFGMNRKQLLQALKYGSSNVNNSRETNDLGRFGMGLKSASLSQCRKLTVISKRGIELSAFSWDIDEIEKTNDWTLLEYQNNEIVKLPSYEKLKEYSHGTLVIWENFDFLDANTGGKVYTNLEDRVNRMVNYVSLVFHRFMNGNRIEFYINDRRIEPLDPFLASNPLTDTKPESRITMFDKYDSEQTITIKPYVLPFQNKLTEQEQKKAGGIENFRGLQGFYIYRSKRLIIWGTWFDMAPKKELAKYARIQVDIPNTLDDVWNIDIRKQSATLPLRIRKQLKQKVQQALDISTRKSAFRSRLADGSNTNNIWQKRIGRENKVFFSVNLNAPLIENIRKSIGENDFSKVEQIIHSIEETLPGIDIYNAYCNNKLAESSDMAVEEKDKIIEDAERYLTLLEETQDKKDAIEELLATKPFCDYYFLREMLEGGK